MNVDSASSAGSGSAPNQRKERGAIAAQVSLKPSPFNWALEHDLNVDGRLTLP